MVAKRSQSKERSGVVISNKMQKSIIVRIDRTVKHSMYSKTMKRSSNAVVHDEKGLAKLGDKVRIKETRPISKTKKWRLVEVLK